MNNELKFKISAEADLRGIETFKKSLNNINADNATKSVDKLSQRISNMGHSAVAIIGVTSAFDMLKGSISSVVETGMKFDSLNMSLKAVYGNADGAVNAMEYIRSTADTLGLNLESTAESFKMFAASTMNTALEGQKAHDVFTGVSEAVSVMGLSADQHQGVMLALSQMMSKGKVSAEELNGQLGERLPGALKLSADAMGVSTAKLYDMMQKGQLLSEEFLPKLAAQLHKTYGDDAVTAAESARAAMNRFDNSITDLKISIANSGVLDFAVASAKIGQSAINSVEAIGTLAGGLVLAYGAQKTYNMYALIAAERTIALEAAQYAAARSGGIMAGANVAVAGSATGATGATTLLTGAMTRLNLVMRANPILLAIGVTAAAVAYFIDDADSQIKKMDELQDKAAQTNEKLRNLDKEKYSNKGQISELNSQISSETSMVGAMYNTMQHLSGKALENMKIKYNSTLDSIATKTKAVQALQKNEPKIAPPHKEAPKLPKTSGSKGKTDEEIRAEIASLNTSLNDKLFQSTHSVYENAVKSIDDEVARYIKGGADKAKAKELETALLIGLGEKELEAHNKTEDEKAKKIEEIAKLEFDRDEQAKEAIRAYTEGMATAQIDYYTSIGDTSSAYYLQEEQKMKKLAETGWYTNEQMLAIKTADNDKFQKEQWEKDNAYWVNLFDNIGKAMDDQFFNAMTGKFTSFGDWLKDMWSSLTNSLTRGLSKSLADSIMGTGGTGGGIQNIFKSYGGIGSVFGSSMAPASLLGATTDSAGFTTTTGGTVFDAAGQITKAGTDGLGGVGDILNNASSLNSVYNALTGGLSASVANGFAQGAAYTYNGLTAMGMSTGTAGSIAGGIGNFGAGMAAPWTTGASSGLAAQSGAMLGGAALGAAGGYALGSIGDKIFGAETKAANYAAIGGAVGSLAGPLGAVIGASLGALIGGAFGSTKVKGSGYSFSGQTTGENVSDTALTYIDYKKKSWFSSKSWTDYSGISGVEMKKIEGIFSTYDFLLDQLGVIGEVSIKAGRYSGATFQDAIAKSFITQFTGINEKLTIMVPYFSKWFNTGLSSSISKAFVEVTTNKDNPAFTEIYAYWTDYAKAVNKTVAEALTTSVGEYITTTRSFNEWKLGSGTAEQLKFTADYLTKDLASLEAQMGVSGITIDNYLAEYDKAIKAQFTPETITTWKSLGDALISATDANTKYTDSLKEVTKSVQKPADMMLWKVNDATRTAQGETLNTQLLVQIVKALKSIQSTNQFSAPGGLV